MYDVVQVEKGALREGRGRLYAARDPEQAEGDVVAVWDSYRTFLAKT
jgi:hypothetical protein